jgi:hypothetical protein
MRLGLELARSKRTVFTAKSIGSRPINSGERIYEYA